MSKENLNAVIHQLNYRKWLAYLFLPKLDAIIVNVVTILFFTTIIALNKGQEITFLTDLNDVVVIFLFLMLMLRIGNIAIAFLGKIRLIHACILLLGLVGICIKLSTAVSSEIEHERNPSVKAQDVVINSTIPKNDVNTIELSATDSNGGGRLIDQPPLPHHLDPCITVGTKCWEDIQKLMMWLDEVRKQRFDILNEQG